MAQETGDRSFKQDVIDSDVPVLVDFWAPWCGPCRMAAPIIDNVSKKTSGRARVYKVNVDENPIVAQAYGIMSIPTVMVFDRGNAVKTMVGVQREEAYLQALGVS